MKVWKNTKTLDGLIDDYALAETKDEADVILLGSKPFDLGEFPNLKGMFGVGVGRDNIPIEEGRQRHVKAGFPSKETIETIYEETACFTCHLILFMLYRNVGTLDPWVKFGRDILQNKTLLVIGTGNIGGRVARKMEGFLRVRTYDKLSNSEQDLREMLPGADCVSLHIPNVPENRGTVDAEKLALMKDGAVLVNTARGAIVCEEALHEELASGRLAAAFDVFWKEPYEGRLKELHPDSFFMTPHVASTNRFTLELIAKDFRAFVGDL